MPKVITQDLIDKIAELAGRGYSKSAIGRELNLDRTTVRKYWPAEKVEKIEEAKPSIEEEFRLLTKRSELRWDIGEILSRISDRKWETRELRKKGRLATESVKFLKDKVEEVKTLDEWLNFKEDEEFVEGVLKLNGIFKRLAEERYIDIDELLEQEASRKEKVKVKQK